MYIGKAFSANNYFTKSKYLFQFNFFINFFYVQFQFPPFNRDDETEAYEDHYFNDATLYSGTVNTSSHYDLENVTNQLEITPKKSLSIRYFIKCRNLTRTPNFDSFTNRRNFVCQFDSQTLFVSTYRIPIAILVFSFSKQLCEFSYVLSQSYMSYTIQRVQILGLL